MNTAAIAAIEAELDALGVTYDEATRTLTYTDPDGTATPFVIGDDDTQLTDEQVQDIVGLMVDGGTETNIDVNYDDVAAKLNFITNTVAVSVPSAVTDFTVDSAVDGTIIVSHSAPADGGAAISDYIYEIRELPSGTFAAFTDGVDTDLTATLNGLLDDGTGYEIRMASQNSQGLSCLLYTSPSPRDS